MSVANTRTTMEHYTHSLLEWYQKRSVNVKKRMTSSLTQQKIKGKEYLTIVIYLEYTVRNDQIK